MSTRTQPADYVVCVDNADYPASLELHKIYRTLPDEDARADGDLRIVDESGDDYLFPAGMFVPINPPDQVRSSLRRASSSLTPGVRTRGAAGSCVAPAPHTRRPRRRRVDRATSNRRSTGCTRCTATGPAGGATASAGYDHTLRKIHAPTRRGTR